MSPSNEAIRRAKPTMRVEARRRRVALPDKELLSQAVWKRLVALPESDRAPRPKPARKVGKGRRGDPMLFDLDEAAKEAD